MFSVRQLRNVSYNLSMRTIYPGPKGMSRGSLVSLNKHFPPLTNRSVLYNTSRHPSRKFNLDTISTEHIILGLVSTNVIITIAWQQMKTYDQQSFMLNHFTTSAEHVKSLYLHTLVTSLFSHPRPMHLLINAVGLYFIGSPLCKLLGNKRFLKLYFGSGVFASLVSIYEQNLSNRKEVKVGASGTLHSVLTLYILMFPKSTIYVFIIPLPAWLLGTLLAAKEFNDVIKSQRDGSDHVAHIAGAVCGGLYYYLKVHRVLRY